MTQTSLAGLSLFFFCFFLSPQNLQNPHPLDTQYTLPLVFGFLTLPEETAFGHSVEVEASLRDVGEMI